jgi:hypothetical protein
LLPVLLSDFRDKKMQSKPQYIKRKKLSKKKAQAVAESLRIPTFTPDFVESGTWRYIVADAGSQTISFTLEMPIAPFGISHSADALILPFKAVRISKVRMWQLYQDSLTITSNTCSLTFVDRRLVKPIEYSCTGANFAPGFIKKKFGVNDPIGRWYVTGNSESNPEVTLQMTKGSVIEISYCWILSDGGACPTSAGTSLAYPRVYSNRLHTSVDVVGKSYASVLSM